MSEEELRPTLAHTHRLITRRKVAKKRSARWLLALPLVAASVAAFLVCTLVPSAVLGCGNVITLSVDDVARRLTAVEKRLNEGNTVGAVQGLRFVLLVIRGGNAREYEGGYALSEDPGSNVALRVRARAERVFALAVVRRDGLVDRRRVRAGWVPDATRTANFVWAEGVLAAARRASPDAPEAIAHHAEALARLPNRATEAVTALRELDRRDLVPDAWGYGALARLADARRDTAARERALAQCATLAGDHADAVCPALTLSAQR